LTPEHTRRERTFREERGNSKSSNYDDPAAWAGAPILLGPFLNLKADVL
jgi:hypothetical protein